MAIDAVQAVHSSPAVQNIEAIDNAQRNPNPQDQTGASSGKVPRDRVTISPAAHAKQAPSAAERNRSGESR